MANKFAEYKALNLTQTNKDVLAEWREMTFSTRRLMRKKDARNSSSSKGLRRPTDTPAFTTYSLEASKTLSTDTRQ